MLTYLLDLESLCNRLRARVADMVKVEDKRREYPVRRARTRSVTRAQKPSRRYVLLRINATLQAPLLESNSIGAEGAVAMAGALKINLALMTLKIGGTNHSAEP